MTLPREPFQHGAGERGPLTHRNDDLIVGQRGCQGVFGLEGLAEDGRCHTGPFQRGPVGKGMRNVLVVVEDGKPLLHVKFLRPTGAAARRCGSISRTLGPAGVSFIVCQSAMTRPAASGTARRGSNGSDEILFSHR